jgi:hypothetical protein
VSELTPHPVVERNLVRQRRDAGRSYVELLVAVVLLGATVVGTMTALQATVIATTTEREHSLAGQWLESAAKAIETAPFGNCRIIASVPETSVDARRVYNEAIHATPVPVGWTPDQISVQRTTDIHVWKGQEWVAYSAAGVCDDDHGLRLQRVRLTIENPDGQIIDRLEVIRRG